MSGIKEGEGEMRMSGGAISNVQFTRGSAAAGPEDQPQNTADKYVRRLTAFLDREGKQYHSPVVNVTTQLRAHQEWAIGVLAILNEAKSGKTYAKPWIPEAPLTRLAGETISRLSWYDSDSIYKDYGSIVDLLERLITEQGLPVNTVLPHIELRHNNPDVKTTSQLENEFIPEKLWDAPLLHICAWKGNAQAVEMLLEHGADPNVTHVVPKERWYRRLSFGRTPTRQNSPLDVLLEDYIFKKNKLHLNQWLMPFPQHAEEALDRLKPSIISACHALIAAGSRFSGKGKEDFSYELAIKADLPEIAEKILEAQQNAHPLETTVLRSSGAKLATSEETAAPSATLSPSPCPKLADLDTKIAKLEQAFPPLPWHRRLRAAIARALTSRRSSPLDIVDDPNYIRLQENSPEAAKTMREAALKTALDGLAARADGLDDAMNTLDARITDALARDPNRLLLAAKNTGHPMHERAIGYIAGCVETAQMSRLPRDRIEILKLVGPSAVIHPAATSTEILQPSRKEIE